MSQIDIFLNELNVNFKDRTYIEKILRIISELKDNINNFDNNFKNNDFKNNDFKNDDFKNNNLENKNVKDNNIEDNKIKDAKKKQDIKLYFLIAK